MGSLGDGRDPERPVRDQALTTVDARIDRELDTAERLPLVRQSEAIMERDPPLLPVTWKRINGLINHVKRLNSNVSHSPLGLAFTSLPVQSKMRVWVCRKPVRSGVRGAARPLEPKDGCA